MAKNPATVTIYGRLSFPVFGHAEAVARNAKSKFPKDDPAKVTPEFNLLVEQAQLDKLVNHILHEFLPFCIEQSDKGEKRNALTKAEAKRVAAILESGDWDAQPPYIPIKTIGEKTQPLAPETVANVKVSGMRGQDIVQQAIVNSEDELLVPDPDLLTYPVIKPITQTVHTMYPGAYVAATLNLYAYLSGKVPGVTASASTAIFKMDGERFGGGIDIDEDEIFQD